MSDERQSTSSRRWLWDSLRAEQADTGEVPDDASLHDYRAGHLETQAATRLEWRLSRSRRGRQRLAELAGVEPAAPSGTVRDRVLGTAQARRSNRRLPIFAAAAAMAAMVLLALWIGSPGSDPAGLPAGLDFDVRLEGLAQVRGAETSTQAYADTPVRISIEPKDLAVDGLQFRVYGRRGDSLVRLDNDTTVSVTAHRGAAEIVALSAADLAGPEPGLHELYLLVSPQGELPAVVATAEDLENLSSGRVYRRTLEIIATKEGEE